MVSVKKATPITTVPNPASVSVTIITTRRTTRATTAPANGERRMRGAVAARNIIESCVTDPVSRYTHTPSPNHVRDVPTIDTS